MYNIIGCLVVFSFFAGCATQPDVVQDKTQFDSSRSIASDDGDVVRVKPVRVVHLTNCQVTRGQIEHESAQNHLISSYRIAHSKINFKLQRHDDGTVVYLAETLHGSSRPFEHGFANGIDSLHIRDIGKEGNEIVLKKNRVGGGEATRITISEHGFTISSAESDGVDAEYIVYTCQAEFGGGLNSLENYLTAEF